MAKAGARTALIATSSFDPGIAAFDIVLIETDRRLSFDLVVRSARGVLALPSTDTRGLALDELAVCSRPTALLAEDESGRSGIPESSLRHFFLSLNAREALLWLFESATEGHSQNPEELLRAADQIHNMCYPLGELGQYRESAINYEAAALLMASKDSNKVAEAIVSYYDALGDHCYYHEEDYFRAASYYHRAYRIALELVQNGNQKAEEVFLFLRSIVVESAALAFAQAGDFALARTLVLEAAKRYASAGHFAVPQTADCYKHTVTGLLGWADLLQAQETAALGQPDVARLLLDAAKAEYAEALRRQPLWAESGFSDAHSRTEAEVEEVERRLRAATRTSK
jgi:tetratricopeptide (TPR) repeat protein